MTDRPEDENTPLDAFQASWRNEPTDKFEVSLMDIHKRARRLQLKCDIDFYGGLVCLVIMLAILGYGLTIIHDGLMRLAYFLMGIGGTTALVYYSQHQLRRPDRKVLAEPSEACFDSYRRLLMDRIQLARTAWAWVLLPVLPGPLLAFYCINRALAQPHANAHMIHDTAQAIVLGCEIIFVMLLVGLPLDWRNQIKARTKELQGLGAMQ